MSITIAASNNDVARFLHIMLKNRVPYGDAIKVGSTGYLDKETTEVVAA